MQTNTVLPTYSTVVVISCEQFSDWSIFLVGNFEWWKILGRHLFVVIRNRDVTFSEKIKTWKSGRG